VYRRRPDDVKGNRGRSWIGLGTGIGTGNNYWAELKVHKLVGKCQISSSSKEFAKELLWYFAYSLNFVTPHAR
jgi:hypothetical protein